MSNDPQSRNFVADVLRCTADWISMHGNDRDLLARNLRDLTELLRNASLLVRFDNVLYNLKLFEEKLSHENHRDRFKGGRHGLS